MRLTTLEIKGFKSFADRTIINFSEDVIGIVGPNGCGKSNIVDAIRWVLGEQKSSQLRSDKMENIIFNGTKDRKPAGLAEVTLTFENNKGILPMEYNNVSIKRMLYRTGDSEYRLNDVKCRLKDITTLLADTGMGSDSYAIIALGMVDDILNDKENSRRQLFEQAAGISKYKLRKKETLSKLDSAEADLARVEDVLFEIDTNLKMLEKQAKRARRFLEMKAEYKESSVDLAIHRLTDFQERYKALEDKLTLEEDKLTHFDVQIAEADASLEKEKLANVDKERQLTDKQKGLNTMAGRIRGLENDKKMLSQKDLFVQENGSKLDKSILQGEDKIEQLLEDLDRYTDKLESETAVLAVLQRDMDEAKAKTEEIRGSHSAMKTELESFLKEQQEIQQQIFEAEKRRAVAEAKQGGAQQEIERLTNAAKERGQDVETLQQDISELEETLKHREAEILALQSQEAERVEQLLDLEADLEDLKERLAAQNRSLDAKRNEYKLTKSMLESLEGSPESIKFLAKHPDFTAKGAPLLSDILLPQAAYRAAIESYLEPYLNYYVLETYEDAIGALGLLAEAKKGKANFFILSELDKQGLKSNAGADLSGEGFTSALSVIASDKKYAALLHFLLDGVWITENTTAFESADFDAVEAIVIAKDGSKLRRAFRLSGGSVGVFEGKRLGRQQHLDNLEQDIKGLEQENAKLNALMEELRRQIQGKKALNFEKTIKQQKHEQEQVERKLLVLRSKADNAEAFRKDNTAKQDAARLVIETAFEDIRVANESLAAAEANLTVVRNYLAQADGNYRQVAETLSAASGIYNQKNIAFIQQQNILAAIEKDISYSKRQLEDTQLQLQRNRTDKANAEAEQQRVTQEIMQIERDLLRMYDEKKAYEKTLTEAEQDYYQSRTQLNGLDDHLRRITRQRTDTQTALSDLNNRFTQLKSDITALSDRLQVEFNIDAKELLKETPKEGVTKEELELRVDSLRSRLHNYGEVNPMAVEAYDEMKTRYDFIVEQREDLAAAKLSLEATIAEIESKAVQQFNQAFYAVRGHFQEVFRRLFTEDDTCDLILSDPERPLDSNILIIAKPKGKRPLTINQLSGGEKTLTATALLFSLYLLKPAPFCIFDEVDAPLDDANVAKFNKIITKFSENSQFIIVTHNKQTMAAVKTIYGVTMQKLGVSEVLPVEFSALMG